MNIPPKILLIDDDQRTGKTIRNFLTSKGYNVIYADNGALGIQQAFEHNPDLVLCANKMEHIDGHQVFNALKNNSLINPAPFIFLSDSFVLDDFRCGMNLGADDFFCKPFKNEDLLRSIENRLGKFRALKDSARREFNALFKLSPNGIFLFNSQTIIDANPVLLQILELNREEISKQSIGDIFEPVSMQRLNEKLQRSFTGFGVYFSENATLKSKSGHLTDITLCVSVYEDTSKYPMMIGLIIPRVGKMHHGNNEETTTEVIKMLKKENITISNSLGKKITEVFSYQNDTIGQQNIDLFSKRENQVLNLSMEGLPMKLIANRLSISDRTVEKHRAKLMEKTGSNNIVEVIVYALRNNLVAI